MAIRAQNAWWDTSNLLRHRNTTVIDVGGAGSPFWKMIGGDVFVVDPKENETLEDHILDADLASQVFCLSVIEHVEDLPRFLYHLGCLVAPGGLLFLTTDCREEERPGDPLFPVDDRHFNWDRRRIFTPGSLQWVRGTLSDSHFTPLGDLDLTYTQPFENWGYTVASLCLSKAE